MLFRSFWTPPGGVGGRGGLHTGAWRDWALASDLGTRRSPRTGRKGMRRAARKPKKGDSRRKTRCNGLQRQKRRCFWGRSAWAGGASGPRGRRAVRPTRVGRESGGRSRGEPETVARARGGEGHAGSGPQPSGATPSDGKYYRTRLPLSRH